MINKYPINLNLASNDNADPHEYNPDNPPYLIDGKAPHVFFNDDKIEVNNDQ